MTPDRKVRKLMQEYQKTGNLTKSALRSDMDPKTARKYIQSGKYPSQLKVEHTWRTRLDPFSEHWSLVEGMLEAAPELEAKTLFEWLCENQPGKYHAGQLRTFQRRVRGWRALSGPPKDIYFPQNHPPGKRMATDFTWMNKLGITICGDIFPHLFCHSVLVYSNWEWGSICQSESLLALRKGLQATFQRLGHLPNENWTDHSTAATHVIQDTKKSSWEFNRQYLNFMDHFGVIPRTINVAAPHENGDIESSNGALKRRVEQHLLLRGSRDFNSVDEYVVFLEMIMEKANILRQKRLGEELAVMRQLDVRLLPEYTTVEARVNSWGTVQVDRNTYSLPSRLKGEEVKARIYEDHIEIFYNGVQQLTASRLLGKGKHTVNYRHIIDSLMRKPGAFRHYKYREDMFPTYEFRWAYDELCEACTPRTADMEYIRILKQAAQTMESQVQSALKQLQSRGEVPRWKTVMEFFPKSQAKVPELQSLVVNLEEYDHLIQREEVAV